MSQHNTPINYTPCTGGSGFPAIFSSTNTQELEPLTFQDIILRAKKSMVINIIDNHGSNSAIQELHKYIELLDDAAKANL